MVSPLFPPSGVVGAKRALHFARHLPALGWTPAVVALPADVEPDPELERWVPEVPIWRGFQGGPVAWIEDALGRRRTIYPDARRPGAATNGTSHLPRWVTNAAGVAAAFDHYTRYLPWSFAGALAFLARQKCEAIHVSFGPRTGIFLGVALARVTGLPLVLDLRDPWSITPAYRASRTAAGQRAVEALELASFQRAARIVVNTESARAAYRELYRDRIPDDRWDVIRNCYDPELYGTAPPAPPDDVFRIFYYGHLRPQKSAVSFLRAYRRFLDEARLDPGGAILTTIGTRTAADEAAIAEMGLAPFVDTHPNVSFTRCRELLGRADLLLDVNGPGHHLQISAKIYDYLACGRPILSVSPMRELGEILESTGAGRRVDLDERSIVDALIDARAAKLQSRPFAPRPEALAPYQAPAAAAKLASVLEHVTV